jgi:hypothetical protein
MQRRHLTTLKRKNQHTDIVPIYIQHEISANYKMHKAKIQELITSNQACAIYSARETNPMSKGKERSMTET